MGTDSYSDACIYTVMSDLPTLRAMLQSLVSPDVCTKSLCLSKDIVNLSQQSEGIGLTPPANDSYQINHAYPLITLFPTKQYLPMTPLEDAINDDFRPTCLLCEYVMDKLEHYLKKRPTVEQIGEYLNKFCNAIPTTFQDRR